MACTSLALSNTGRRAQPPSRRAHRPTSSRLLVDVSLPPDPALGGDTVAVFLRLSAVSSLGSTSRSATRWRGHVC
jgi:hypothetical protein